jgi:HPt (histidine-containing phosphotransfer) domain-containing protein
MQPDADQQPVLDLDHLMTFTDGDKELENELSALYLSSAEAYLDAMSRALCDGTSWTSSVHALKGASSNLGALRVATLARAAEHQPRDRRGGPPVLETSASPPQSSLAGRRTVRTGPPRRGSTRPTMARVGAPGDISWWHRHLP